MIKKYAFLAFVVVILLNFAVDSKCFLGPYRSGKRGSIAKGKHETITSVRDTIDATEDRGINRETHVPLRFFQVQKGGV